MKKFAVLAALSVVLSLTAHAKKDPVPLNEHELAAATCMLASQGIHSVSVDRQAGKTKVQAKKQLDADLKKLRASLSSPAYVKRISDVWYRGLDRVYQLPVFDLPEEREAFVSIMTEDALVSCMASLLPEV